MVGAGGDVGDAEQLGITVELPSSDTTVMAGDSGAICNCCVGCTPGSLLLQPLGLLGSWLPQPPVSS